MSESIPTVILRLARRHLPVDATVPVSPARPDSEPADPLIDAAAPLSREQDDASTREHMPITSPEPSPAADSRVREGLAVASIPHTIAADPVQSESLEIAGVEPDDHRETINARPQSVVQASRLQSADGSWRAGTPKPALPPHTAEPDPSITVAEAFACESDPAFERPYMPRRSFAFESEPSLSSGRPEDDSADDSFEPAGRSATTVASSHNQSPVDPVGESSRLLEDSARNLESSLTRLFTTQIETLQRLRDKIAEHERRWIEQQSARRATL